MTHPEKSSESSTPYSPLAHSEILKQKDEKINDLNALIETISRGKYMWEATFDAIMDPVMIVSGDYRIQRANIAAAKAAHLDVREMNGQICHEILAGFPSPCVGCPLKDTLAASVSATAELTPFMKGGRSYHVNAYPLVTQEGENQAVLHYRNVSEERELQRKLIQSEKLAAIGTLAGGVAHEINNPLAGILAFTQLVMKELGKDHSAFEDLKEVEDATLRCKQIVQDLLDFSRQNHEEKMKSVDLNHVIRKVMSLAKVQSRASQVHVVMELAENLPFILGHSNKLQQVVLNLVTNAFQAMQEKGGTLSIVSRFNETENRVEIDVSDTGCGIPAEHLSKIFDPYFTTKELGQGTGLGLSISYGIVQENKGVIEVESIPGKGSKFKLAFPAAATTN